MRAFRLFIGCLSVTALAVALAPANAGGLWTSAVPGGAGPVAGQHAPSPLATRSLGQIKHLIFIIQENRSFDSYFGTYPGADGIPSPFPCLPSVKGPCISSYLNHADENFGGPYENQYQVADVDNGKMNGFVIQRDKELAREHCGTADFRSLPDDEGEVQPDVCVNDVMGYHDGTDLPNYWAYAKNFVLFDHFYESVESWSLPAHLAIFSGWSAKCTQLNPPDVDSCASSPGGEPWPFYGDTEQPVVKYLWTDITYLLWKHNVSWTVYNDGGLDREVYELPGVQHIWNVLPGFETVNDDGQLANAEVNLTQFYKDVKSGNLPQVTWLLPKFADSEHPTADISAGQTYTTKLINAIMSSPEWSSSAIFLEWDDMGGFYDHEPPPFALDSLGLGLRVPALLISPFAKTGVIDHQYLSSDSFLKLIEDDFTNGNGIASAGRPDPRPDYRDTSTRLGNIDKDFDWNKPPRPPLLLAPHPMSLLRDGYSLPPPAPLTRRPSQRVR